MMTDSTTFSPEYIDQLVARRQAVRVFDDEAPYDPEVVKKCVARATQAPNSSNMQLWEFYKIIDPVKRQKIVRYCMNQSAARTAKELLVVVVRKDLWRHRAQFNLQKVQQQLESKKPEEYTKRDLRGLQYYRRVMPILYADFLGLFGYLKWVFFGLIGFFRPVYREVLRTDTNVVAHKSAALAAQTFMLSMTAEGYDTCPMEGLDTWRVKRVLGLPRGAEISMVIACGIRKPEGVYHERRRLPLDEVYFEV